MSQSATMRAKAAQIAEEVLHPAAAAVDRAARLPATHLDLLAAEGFYGVAAPPDEGGLGVEDTATVGYLIETLASGCLATTFVWMQHHSAVLAAAYSGQPGVRERWLGPLSRGERRAGIGLAGLRPGPKGLLVEPVTGGYRLDGETPWVTGWNMIDTLLVAARDAADVIHFLLIDAASGPTLAATPLDLVAAQASRTVELTFNGHVVPADRLVSTEPYDEWARSDASGSALNGFLALGVANRGARLLDSVRLKADLDTCRTALVAASGPAIATARADASHLALRTAAELAVRTGSRSVLAGHHAQRLLREAGFLLVFGSRPTIRDALLDRLAR